MSKILDQSKILKEEFSKQAENFNDVNHSIANPEVMEWILQHIPCDPEFQILDAAAGTSLMGRALAGKVKKVIAFDATEEMLATGAAAAKKDQIENIDFHCGMVEEMPFRDGYFDLVVCRLAFHHFLSPLTPLKEMLRVKKSGSPLIIIDILSPEDDAKAKIYNEIEKKRDHSHVWAFSAPDFGRLLAQAKATGDILSIKKVEVDFENWIKLTNTPLGNAMEIRSLLQKEISDKEDFGFGAFWHKDRLKFRQSWAIFSVR